MIFAWAGRKSQDAAPEGAVPGGSREIGRRAAFAHPLLLSGVFAPRVQYSPGLADRRGGHPSGGAGGGGKTAPVQVLSWTYFQTWISSSPVRRVSLRRLTLPLLVRYRYMVLL